MILSFWWKSIDTRKKKKVNSQKSGARKSRPAGLFRLLTHFLLVALLALLALLVVWIVITEKIYFLRTFLQSYLANRTT
jgi:hypothetical protein